MYYFIISFLKTVMLIITRNIHTTRNRLSVRPEMVAVNLKNRGQKKKEAKITERNRRAQSFATVQNTRKRNREKDNGKSEGMMGVLRGPLVAL